MKDQLKENRQKQNKSIIRHFTIEESKFQIRMRGYSILFFIMGIKIKITMRYYNIPTMSKLKKNKKQKTDRQTTSIPGKI